MTVIDAVRGSRRGIRLGAWVRAACDAERTWDCEPGNLAWRGDPT